MYKSSISNNFIYSLNNDVNEINIFQSQKNTTLYNYIFDINNLSSAFHKINGRVI